MWEQFQNAYPSIAEWIQSEGVKRAFILALIGFPSVFLASRLIGRLKEGSISPQNRLLFQKGILYGGVIILTLSIMNELQFELTAILGAAGIMGIAVGFAAQAGLSNIISGIFLIMEKPFVVGDIIDVGGTVGTIVEIDLLSVKVRTFDNRLVRIPNENIVKTEVTNITRYPIRRMDMIIGVAYKEDIESVCENLKEVARNNPLVLDEPEPVVVFKNFGDSALEIQYGVWFVGSDYLKVRHSIMVDIKKRFDAEDIEIPFPHRTIYTGEVTKPWPVKVLDEKAKSDHGSESNLSE